MNVDDFDFALPEGQIAQTPAARGGSRLLVLDADGRSEHAVFANLGRYLRAGDLLVVNNTRVFPARLLGQRAETGGAVECLLLRQLPSAAVAAEELWEALVHPGQKLKPGAEVIFERDGVRIQGVIVAMHFQGRRTIRLSTDHAGGVAAAIERIGHVPLPPYIKRADSLEDKERYQTVYAAEHGSVAAPTAGLHFTRDQLDELASAGVERTEVTLHVGYGTFKPVKVSRVE
jgi:S-adenosylmethionine:tRNA ribosyltransferase-isomerase